MRPEQLKILIVEDDPIDRDILRLCLQESALLKFELAVADSAAAGILLAGSWSPDCMLLDYDLPDMNGLEVLARIKSDAGTLPFAIVMLTAWGGEGLAVEAMKAGVMDYLPKGQIARDTLVYTVVDAVRKFQMQCRIAEHRSALERSQRRYELLLEAIPQMVWTANADGIVEYANRRWLDYTGLALPEAGHFVRDELLHPKDPDRTWMAWESARESGSVFEIEHRLRRASDGLYRWHLVRAVPMKRQSGEVTNWFGTCTEVEDQKQAERANLEREKFEGLGRLAGGIAHDFNNLLVSILGGASFVKDILDPSHPAQTILSDVVLASERAAALTRKMLAYSGKSIFFAQRVEANPIVREACETLRRSLPKTIQLQVETEAGLPPVETDSEAFQQVIRELLNNAVEAVVAGSGEPASGTIWVRTKFAEIDPETAREQDIDTTSSGVRCFVAVEVQDTGCGMDVETQRRIFDPFFTTKFAGRGMGLAAVRGFVRSNRGAIRVSSGMGEGTLVQILLPPAETAGEHAVERGEGDAVSSTEATAH